MELVKRNVHLISTRCSFCGEEDETADHLSVSCGLAQKILAAVVSWCKGTSLFAFSAMDLVQSHRYINGSRLWKKSVYMVVQAMLWCIWRSRNNLIFRHETTVFG
ncbi:hypothetical protein Hdeb2414_s0010g00346031 [Helianthus debilis subsp. tardiflorus]